MREEKRERICVILNPSAGSAQTAESVRRRLLEWSDVDLWSTRERGHARDLAREAGEHGYTIVVAAGGDGTLGEVVDGLAGTGSDARVGLLPMGTGNDFARSLGIPTDAEGALDVLRRGRRSRVDLMRLRSPEGSRWVVNAVTGGFSAVVDEKLTAESKEWFGRLAFLVSAGKALPELSRYRVRLDLDGSSFEHEAYNVVIANGRSVGGGIEIAPEARVDDGRLDVLVVPAGPLPELAAEIGRLVGAAPPEDGALVRRTARTVRMESDPPLPLTRDGEVRGETPVEVAVRPRAATFIVGDGTALT